MKKVFIFFIAIIIIFVSISAIKASRYSIYKQTNVTIGGRTFDGLISDTDILRSKGLGQRTSLDSGQIMLFVFDKADVLGFWMKDMKFAIDIMWLDSNFNIVWIENNISPDTYPKIYSPKEPALYVIETNAGILQNLGVKIGDKVSVPAFSR